MVSFIFTLLKSQFPLPYGLQNYETQYWINEPCKGTNYPGSHFCIDYSVIKDCVNTALIVWKMKAETLCIAFDCLLVNISAFVQYSTLYSKASCNPLGVTAQACLRENHQMPPKPFIVFFCCLWEHMIHFSKGNLQNCEFLMWDVKNNSQE